MLTENMSILVYYACCFMFYIFIGGDVAKIAAMTEAAFTAERNFIALAAKSKKPSDKVSFSSKTFL